MAEMKAGLLDIAMVGLMAGLMVDLLDYSKVVARVDSLDG